MYVDLTNRRYKCEDTVNYSKVVKIMNLVQQTFAWAKKYLKNRG